MYLHTRTHTPHTQTHTHTHTWAVGGVLTLALVTVIVPDPTRRTHCAEAVRSATQGISHPQVFSLI